MEILRVEDLSFRYPKADAKALDGISFSVNEGDFILVCGESGCGKTTLLRMLKKEISPAGEKSGRVYYRGVPADGPESGNSAAQIGFVFQDPDDQIVTDKVWHELAFGLENLGVESPVIRRRIGETASYFGIHGWFRRPTDELSDGQKQILNLASVMVMRPRLLILDEPTARLDPIAASEFISTLRKLNRELGLTVVIAEHRLEELFAAADRVMVLDGGRAVSFDAPRAVCAALKDHRMADALPAAARIFGALAEGDAAELPLTVREGRALIERDFDGAREYVPDEAQGDPSDPALELDDVWFRYGRDLPDVMRGTSFSVRSGEIFCLLGGNGTGKTTTLDVIAGLERPYRGRVRVNGKKLKEYRGAALYRRNLAYLPQDSQAVFTRDSVRADLADICEAAGVPKDARAARIAGIAGRLGVAGLLDRHPFDLSGGEIQRCAIAKALLSEPRVLLLDEPTKGMDARAKRGLGQLMKELKDKGVTILAVSHDVEFAAEFADRCALFFDGEALPADTPERFFAENSFYTTAANRIAGGLWRYAVTCDRVIELCRSERSAGQ